MGFVGLVSFRCINRSLYLRNGVAVRASKLCASLPTRSLHSQRRQRPPLIPNPIPLASKRFPRAIPELSITSFRRQYSTSASKPERHENIYTIPNILTFSRLLSTPVIAYLILDEKPYLATSLLLYAGLTDLIDGWIARRYKMKSVVGTVIDPMADKFLMVTLTGSLAYTGAMPRLLPFGLE